MVIQTLTTFWTQTETFLYFYLENNMMVQSEGIFVVRIFLRWQYKKLHLQQIQSTEAR